IHIAILICIYTIFSVSYNVALGYTGLITLAHVALYGIGAYTSALLTRAGYPFISGILLAGVVAAIFGFFLVYTTRKLKGDYLAMATLGFAFVAYSIEINWTGLTRGALGLPGIVKPALFGFRIGSNVEMLLFVFIVAVISIAIMWRIVRSGFGRLMEATRDDETGVEVLGKNAFAIKAKAMMISAFFAGIAGSLFAHYISYIDPGTFYLTEIILLLTIVIVGGAASMRGSIIGAVLVVVVGDVLRLFDLPSVLIGPSRHIIYAVLLLCVLLYRPRGILGRVDLI
ncbi:MAG: branched-chain amino acid ABC transporter permease, partial [Anaerolineales bacterium]|nr:branched-chain amino acid ABC transporter permease [Anaerolineales bacterium]